MEVDERGGRGRGGRGCWPGLSSERRLAGVDGGGGGFAGTGEFPWVI